MSNPWQDRMVQTERLMLRPLVMDDADKLFPILSDLETMRFMPTPPHPG